MEPTALVERLAALVPRPHKNLVVYHGVLGANARWRQRAIAYGRPRRAAEQARTATPTARGPNPTWAELMRRGLNIDALQCPKCHGRLRFLATITVPATVRRILRSLGLPTQLVVPAPARAPPESNDDYFDVA